MMEDCKGLDEQNGCHIFKPLDKVVCPCTFGVMGLWFRGHGDQKGLCGIITPIAMGQLLVLA